MAAVDYGVVVGYDGSSGADKALRWAIREADKRRTTLTVCLAWTPPYLEGTAERSAEDHATRKAGQILAPGVQYAMSALSESWVQPMLVRGPAAKVLCETSSAAQMTVIGSRGHDWAEGAKTGPVAWQVAESGRGPVVVVRGQWHVADHAPGPIAVGADQSPTSRAALEFAFIEADLHKLPLIAVCALADSPAALGGARQMEADFGHTMDLLEKAHPDVAVVRQVVPESPRAALLTAAGQAQLLIVGCRGRGGVEGMSLGSTAHAMLCSAPCPVAVVHRAVGG